MKSSNLVLVKRTLAMKEVARSVLIENGHRVFHLNVEVVLDPLHFFQLVWDHLVCNTHQQYSEHFYQSRKTAPIAEQIHLFQPINQSWLCKEIQIVHHSINKIHALANQISDLKPWKRADTLIRNISTSWGKITFNPFPARVYDVFCIPVCRDEF